MVELEGRQHPDHDELCVLAVHALVGTFQGLPQFLFEFDGGVAGQRTGFDIHLDVELPELGLEHGRVVDGLENLEVRHRRRHVVAHEIELDLHAELRFRRLVHVDERVVAQHAVEHRHAGLHLAAELTTVVTGEGPYVDLGTHDTPVRSESR